MGGGSADAAGVLFGLNRLWHTGLSPAELESLGLELGADVPFCLRGGLTRTRGIGEAMENLPVSPVWPLIVIQPCRGLSTRQVFQNWREDPTLRHPDNDRAIIALKTNDLVTLRQSLYNVLQPVSVSLRPEIGSAVRRLREAGADVALMTGSGSAVFGVFRSTEKARTVLPGIALLWRSSFLCHTCPESIRILEE